VAFDFEPLPLAGLLRIQPRIFEDARGSFLERYRRSAFEAAGIREAFVQDNHSVSSRGVLRGIHYQVPPRAQGKLVWVVRGAVWDVCVDLRRASPTFARWYGADLSAANGTMLYVPAGFGHGFVTLSESAEFLYKCTDEYDARAERGVRWDDPELAITWPLGDVTVSPKDASLPTLAQAEVFGPPVP
jgi:dTDP-4-dehydrorhamnose 3,5-epimerase